MCSLDLSIVVPVYNVELYVKQCIESLQAQDAQNFEVIIVDDGSKDTSISICESLIQNDSRFRIIHKSNGGLMSAWKRGVQEAQGMYIGFVDSDDWVDANMFSVLLKHIKENDADIVCSGHVAERVDQSVITTRDRQFVFDCQTIRSDFIPEYCSSYLDTNCKPTICRWDKIYRKDILLNNFKYFDEKISMGEDFNTNIPVFLSAEKIVLIPDFYPYHYRDNPKSIVNTINKKAFYNIHYLADNLKQVCADKAYDSFYIDSFIGNMIFEETNRICSKIKMDSEQRKILKENLDLCNSNYYLDAYSKLRNTSRISIYAYFIKKRHIGMIVFMNKIYNLISKKY